MQAFINILLIDKLFIQHFKKLTFFITFFKNHWITIAIII
jgi:hypothetical protein